MKYISLAKNQYILGDYKIAPLRKVDIQKIRVWRNNQRSVLRQNNIISPEEQLKYYYDHILPTFNSINPSQILFSYLYKGKCIGYGGLTNIDWNSRKAELSFLVADSRAKSKVYKVDMAVFMILIKQVAFLNLRLRRIISETYEFRSSTIEIIESSGFTFEGRLRKHVFVDGKYVDSLLHSILMEEYL